MAKPLNQALRGRILSCAFKLFRSQGFHATTTRQIAAEAGTERGLLSHYFQRKQDILFALYTDFLDCIFRFAARHYEGHGGYTMIGLMNALYYRVIFLHADVMRIFADILQNRELTRMKIDKTTDVYARMLERRGAPLPRETVALAAMVAIGAEVELVLAMLEESLGWDRRQLTGQITRLTLLNLPGAPDAPADITALLEQAYNLAEQADLEEFARLMRENCPWFDW